MAQAPSKRWWIVRSSSIHQRGVFARCDIPKDTPIIEYVGDKISKAESDRRGKALMARSARTGGAAVYIFTLNKRQDLDGSVRRNTARLINHSCDPNCEAIISRGRIWIHALRDIAAGEELSFNYGFDLETWEDHPCRCGKPNCVGYILDREFWPKLRRILRTREARRRRLAELEARAAELAEELRELEPRKAANRSLARRRSAVTTRPAPARA